MTIAPALLAVLLGAAAPALARCDVDGDGAITDADARVVLGAAAGLEIPCAPQDCDVDNDGLVTDVDAVNVFRGAADLASTCSPVAARLTPIVEGLDRPIAMAALPGDPARLAVAEQTGRIRIVRDGVLQPAAFLDLNTVVSCCGERGLLGLAFHPGYAANRRFFVHYTDGSGNTVVAEYARRADDPERAQPEVVQTLLTAVQPADNHNGGTIAFGADGHLYVAMGDGGTGGDEAQDPDSRLGKILRVDVDDPGTAPEGNVVGGDPLVWDLGLRNPFRMSFDRLTGALYIGDVGEDAFEEINVEPAGGGNVNYGWNVTEGPVCFDPPQGCNTTGLTPPILAYDHTLGCSVIGGYVYRGAALPALRGRYLYGDFCSNRIFSFVASDGVAVDELELTTELASTEALSGLTSFGEDHAGELYVMDLSGTLARIEPE